MRTLIAFTVLVALRGVSAAEEHAAVLQHVKVYYEAGRYGGWPANHGIWSWGNEILVGFGRGHYKDLGTSHHLDRDKPEEHWFARSLDGGETWNFEDPSKQGMLIPWGSMLLAQPVPGHAAPEPKPLEEPIDFTHPDLAFVTSMYSAVDRETSLYYSYDRGKTWKGPFRMPDLGLGGMSARTNYVVNGKRDCMVFLNSHGDGEDPVRQPFLARTTDGGLTWQFTSWIIDGAYGVMPSGVRVSATELYAAVRRREGEHGWNSGHISKDDGKTWEQVANPVDDLGNGNPPMVLPLRDGRLCITYGDRKNYRIGAKISKDGGRSWGKEIILRADGGSHDMGYTRTVQRPDGKAVTVYYFWDKVTGPERYIAATIWDPEAVTE